MCLGSSFDIRDPLGAKMKGNAEMQTKAPINILTWIHDVPKDGEVHNKLLYCIR